VNPAWRELDAMIGREADLFIDTIKMIAYRAETTMAGSAALACDDDARALIRQIYQCEADLLPDLPAKTLN
jgi:hypothetical protein